MIAAAKRFIAALRLALLGMVALVPMPTSSEEIVAGLSQNRISINANFDGSEILVFGAVKREIPVPANADPLQVIITVSGPSKPVTVRRKEKRYGIWVNTDSAEIESAPSFYAVATTAPLAEILLPEEDDRYNVSIQHAVGENRLPENATHQREFDEALIRIREREGLYQVLEGAVNLSQETLFDTAVRLPSNLTEGDYIARILLTRGGRVLNEYETSISVRKVGLERFLYTLAHEKPLIYGLFSLAIAIAAGWGASEIFRRLKA